MGEPETVEQALAEIHRRSCIPDQHDPTCRLVTSEVERGRALRAAVEALAEDVEKDRDWDSEWVVRARIAGHLRALLAPHVPSPLLDGGAGEGTT